MNQIVLKGNLYPKHISLKNKPNVALFDLDGTLVDTDHIYTKVWDDILPTKIDRIYFDKHIKGKNDAKFLKANFSNIPSTKYNAISKLKDELFISRIDETILVDHAKEFIESIPDVKKAIVTSSNRESAKAILEITGILHHFEFILASEDCIQHKPESYPYIKAMRLLDCVPNETIIFEDSLLGYQSAIGTDPNRVYMFNPKNNDLTHYNCVSFESYEYLDIF